MQSFQDEVRSSKSAVSAESLTTCKHYPVQPSMDSIQQTTEGKETGHIGGGKKATNPVHFHPTRRKKGLSSIVFFVVALLEGGGR